MNSKESTECVEINFAKRCTPTSCVINQHASTVPWRDRYQSGFLNWSQSMLQWFSSFPEFAEFTEILFYLGKAQLTGASIFYDSQILTISHERHERLIVVKRGYIECCRYTTFILTFFIHFVVIISYCLLLFYFYFTIIVEFTFLDT